MIKLDPGSHQNYLSLGPVCISTTRLTWERLRLTLIVGDLVCVFFCRFLDAMEVCESAAISLNHFYYI
jgi:hypothetical protein